MGLGISILVLGGLLVAALLGYAASRPDTFRMERSTHIQAPPEKVFPFLDDFHRWSLWSPWERLDPDLKRSFSGAPSGVGAVYEWTGNKKVGTGRMEMMESHPSHVVVKLDFLKPFEAHNTAEFSLIPAAGGTESGRCHLSLPSLS